MGLRGEYPNSNSRNGSLWQHRNSTKMLLWTTRSVRVELRPLTDLWGDQGYTFGQGDISSLHDQVLSVSFGSGYQTGFLKFGWVIRIFVFVFDAGWELWSQWQLMIRVGFSKTIGKTLFTPTLYESSSDWFYRRDFLRNQPLCCLWVFLLACSWSCSLAYFWSPWD